MTAIRLETGDEIVIDDCELGWYCDHGAELISSPGLDDVEANRYLYSDDE